MIENLLSRLDKVKPKGRGRYIACCSAHEDKTPSLAISEVNGKILLHCFAGCAPIDIIQAVGLDMCDLFPEGGLGEFKGFIQLQREIAVKQTKKETEILGDEKLVLTMAKEMRGRGEKLSQADLKRELEAYKKIKECSNSENPDRR